MRIIDKNEFVSYFGEHIGESSSLRTSTYMSFKDMEKKFKRIVD